MRVGLVFKVRRWTCSCLLSVGSSVEGEGLGGGGTRGEHPALAEPLSSLSEGQDGTRHLLRLLIFSSALNTRLAVSLLVF